MSDPKDRATSSIQLVPQLLGSARPVALGHKLGHLVPVGVVVEHHADDGGRWATTAAGRTAARRGPWPAARRRMTGRSAPWLARSPRSCRGTPMCNPPGRPGRGRRSCSGPATSRRSRRPPRRRRAAPTRWTPPGQRRRRRARCAAAWTRPESVSGCRQVVACLCVPACVFLRACSCVRLPPAYAAIIAGPPPTELSPTRDRRREPTRLRRRVPVRDRHAERDQCGMRSGDGARASDGIRWCARAGPHCVAVTARPVQPAPVAGGGTSQTVAS